MTAFVPPASSIGAGTIFTSVAAGDSLTLLQPFTFFTTNVNAVNISHDNHSVLNMTTLMSGGSNGLVVNAVDNCDIVNAATGTIATQAALTGYTAIHVMGDFNSVRNAGQVLSVNGTGVRVEGAGNVVDNSGTIWGGQAGIVAAVTNYSVINSGTITSGTATLQTVAVFLGGNGNGKSLVNTGVIQALALEGSTGVQVSTFNLTTIDNSGTIRSMGGLAIDASSSASGIHLTNSGDILGSNDFVFAVAATSQSDRITNTGWINHAIDLGDGNDLYIGLGGKVGGTVFGGSGADTYYVDDADIAIFEDFVIAEIDQLYARTSFTLAANIEHLTLLGSADYRGTGNQSDNLITGNAGDNRLGGLVGVDTIFGQAGNDHVSGGGQADSLEGSEGDDTLLGGLGNDTLKGGDDDDVLNGGAGKDTMTAGAGADVIVFSNLAHTASALANADIITDFVRGDDVIDLSAIDAISTNAAPNNAFTFIGGALFSNVAGQLRFDQSGGNTYVWLDTDGNGGAEAIIRLNGLFTLNASDFVL